MKVSTHVISTSIICLILLFVSDWYNAVLFFIGGVLIDVDHYYHYIIRKKTLSLLEAYKWNVYWSREIEANPRKYMIMHICHAVEFLIVVFAISVLVDNYFFFYGVCFHWLLDISYMTYTKTISVRKLSIIQYLIIKSRGKHNRIIL